MKFKTNLRFRVGILACWVLMMLALPAQSQSRKRLKELEKKGQEREAENQGADAEAKQRHLDIQSKQTRKEMKQNQKRSKRYNNNRREPLLKRMFRKKNKR